MILQSHFSWETRAKDDKFVHLHRQCKSSTLHTWEMVDSLRLGQRAERVRLYGGTCPLHIKHTGVGVHFGETILC